MADIGNERERYNDAVASFRQVEYPMVQGIHPILEDDSHHQYIERDNNRVY